MIWFDLDGTLRNIVGCLCKDEKQMTFYNKPCDNGKTVGENYHPQNAWLFACANSYGDCKRLFYDCIKKFLKVGILSKQPFEMRGSVFGYLYNDFINLSWCEAKAPREGVIVDLPDSCCDTVIPVLFVDTDYQKLEILSRYDDWLIDDNPLLEGKHQNLTTPKRPYNNGKEIDPAFCQSFVEMMKLQGHDKLRFAYNARKD
jgi:hypothetical protein